MQESRFEYDRQTAHRKANRSVRGHRVPSGVSSFPVRAAASCAEIHNRMPVILKPDARPVWLGEEPADEPQLKALLAPYPADDMICWPVSACVGNVRNNDSSLIEPVAAA
jgi:putative SOS response-associated peptidase YedK